MKQLRLTVIDGRMYTLTGYHTKGEERFGCRLDAATGELRMVAWH